MAFDEDAYGAILLVLKTINTKRNDPIESNWMWDYFVSRPTCSFQASSFPLLLPSVLAFKSKPDPQSPTYWDDLLKRELKDVFVPVRVIQDVFENIKTEPSSTHLGPVRLLLTCVGDTVWWKELCNTYAKLASTHDIKVKTLPTPKEWLLVLKEAMAYCKYNAIVFILRALTNDGGRDWDELLFEDLAEMDELGVVGRKGKPIVWSKLHVDVITMLNAFLTANGSLDEYDVHNHDKIVALLEEVDRTLWWDMIEDEFCLTVNETVGEWYELVNELPSPEEWIAILRAAYTRSGRPRYMYKNGYF